jgi:hypothetical protein
MLHTMEVLQKELLENKEEACENHAGNAWAWDDMGISGLGL